MMAAVTGQKFDDTMHVIGHDRERMERNVCIVPRYRVPMVVGDKPQLVQFHVFL